jgi:hypothetical protein
MIRIGILFIITPLLMLTTIYKWSFDSVSILKRHHPFIDVNYYLQVVIWQCQYFKETSSYKKQKHFQRLKRN